MGVHSLFVNVCLWERGVTVHESALGGEMCVLWTQRTGVETGSSLAGWSPAAHPAEVTLITAMF